MANVLTRIKQKVNNGDFIISGHCEDALEDEGFAARDAIKAVRNARTCIKMTGDESHIRYVIMGHARDGRALDVVVMFQTGNYNI